MSRSRQEFQFKGMSEAQNRALNDKIEEKLNQVLPAFIQGPYRENLSKALHEQLCTSIEIRNQHQELARTWTKLSHAIEGNKPATAFKELMRKAQVGSFFNVLEHLHPGQDFYHAAEHSAEMRMDNPIANEGGSAGERFLIGQFRAKAGADHDIIQGNLIPLQNEKISALMNERDCLQILSQLNLPELSESEQQSLAKALAQPIIDHTFLILGKDSLATARQEIERDFFTSNDLAERNKNLYFQNAIGFGLEFSDVNRAAYAPIINDPHYDKRQRELQEEIGINAKALSGFNAQQDLSQSSMVNMLIGQGMRMLPEMHNKFRYVADKPGQTLLNEGTRKNMAASILSSLGLGPHDPIPNNLQPLMEKLAKGITAAEVRSSILELKDQYPSLQHWAFVFSTSSEQKAMKDLMAELRLFSVTGEEKYRENYLNLLKEHASLLAKVYITSTIHPLGSNDVGFSLDRDIQKLVNTADLAGVKIGSTEAPVDVFSHYKQALLLDKEKAITELRKKAGEESRSPLERQQLEELIARASTLTDLKSYYANQIQGKPELEQAFLHQVMVHTACQQGFYEQNRFMSENLAEVQQQLASRRSLLADKEPQKLELLDTMISTATKDLTLSRQLRALTRESSLEKIENPFLASTTMGLAINGAKTESNLKDDQMVKPSSTQHRLK